MYGLEVGVRSAGVSQINGFSTTSADGASTAEFLVGGDTTDSPYFTWSQVISTLPIGVCIR